MQRLDTDPAATGRLALVRRFPRGPVLGISPFNFPLNLVAHKIAPAVAVGAPDRAQAGAQDAAVRAAARRAPRRDRPARRRVSVILVPDDRAPALVADPRLPVVSFTGSGPVGYAIREAVPHKHVTLELGGNAAALVCADWSSSADLDWAASRIATFGNYQAGQSLHLGAARARRRVAVRPTSRRAWSRPSRRSCSATPTTRPPTSAR